MRVLIVEDDGATADFLLSGLRQSGYAADHAVNGRDGLILSTASSYDVLVVDRMLPEVDGLNLVRSLRSAGVKTPVLFLTALAGIDDRAEGLKAGGDDYLAKPFVYTEFLARLNALVRRSRLAQLNILTVGDIEMDITANRVRRGGKDIDLQRREFQLLEYLIRNVGYVVTRSMLLENVWGYDFNPKTEIVETHVRRLSAKLNPDNKGAQVIEIVPGAGYMIRVPA